MGPCAIDFRTQALWLRWMDTCVPLKHCACGERKRDVITALHIPQNLPLQNSGMSKGKPEERPVVQDDGDHNEARVIKVGE